jgi:hypothetical protein
MTLPKIYELNALTGESIEREMNEQEIEQYELDQVNEQKRLEAIEERKSLRQNLLSRLGITDEEAKLLLS